MKLSTICVLLLAHLCLAQETDIRISSIDNEERLRQTLFSKYNREILPDHNKTSPVSVDVGLSLTALKKIDFQAQALDIEGWVSFRWNDTRLRWDPKEYGDIQILRVVTSKLWVPDVTLYNGVNHGDSEWMQGSRSIHVVLYSSGQIIWVPAASLKAFCNLDLSGYPYDTHICSLKFGSWVYDGFHVDLNVKGGARPLDISNFYNGSEWKVGHVTVKKTSTYYDCCKEPYPDITFNITLQRQNTGYQATVLAPLVTGIILTLVAYMTSPFRHVRLALNAFNTLFFLLTLFHLQSQLPSVGINTPYIVLICQGMMLLLSVSMAWSVFVLAATKRCRRTKSPQMLNRFLSSWPTKVLFVTGGQVTMQEGCRKSSETSKDSEIVNMVAEDAQSVSGWMKFILFLDRLGFLAVSVAVVWVTSVFMN